jgi:hypothetical protein
MLIRRAAPLYAGFRVAVYRIKLRDFFIGMFRAHGLTQVHP